MSGDRHSGHGGLLYKARFFILAYLEDALLYFSFTLVGLYELMALCDYKSFLLLVKMLRVFSHLSLVNGGGELTYGYSSYTNATQRELIIVVARHQTSE